MNECVNARLGRGLTRCDVRVATLGAIPRSRVEELPSSRAGVLRRAILRQRRRGTSRLARARARASSSRARLSWASIGLDHDRSIDRRDRPSRSIDRSCDPIDLIRSPDERFLDLGFRGVDVRTCGVDRPTDRFFSVVSPLERVS